jgi:hypothetical protein
MAMNDEARNFLNSTVQLGKAIPGSSLTRSPDDPYPWEKPTEFSNLNESMMYVFETLTVPETTSNILLSLIKGVSVIDIASVALYTGFTEGKWNPDVMLLLMEPTMYMIIALAEKADVNYILDANDENEPTQMTPEKQINELKQGVASLDTLRKQAAARINPQAVPKEIKKIVDEVKLAPSLLEKIDEEKPTSLLGKEV